MKIETKIINCDCDTDIIEIGNIWYRWMEEIILYQCPECKTIATN